MRMFFFEFLFIVIASTSLMTPSAFAGDDPFADLVESYEPGTNPAGGYTTPETALGSPERFTGEGIFPGVVSAFNPPFGADEIVSIGAGGHIILQFNPPVHDDPNNLYGIDLLIFGNTSFIDVSFPDGVAGGLFGNDGGTVEVSADGERWFIIEKVQADGPLPTVGFVDSGPFDGSPGTVLTDFTRPVDPALATADFLGLNNQQIIQLYRGSGGGVAIDIAQTGLLQISYVRIANPADAVENIEVDAISDVAPRLPGDVNLDNVVNVLDLLMLIGAWGAPVPGGPPADLDNSRSINVLDLLIIIANWSS